LKTSISNVMSNLCNNVLTFVIAGASIKPSAWHDCNPSNLEVEYFGGPSKKP
jgi:hypothetical protein